MINFCIGLVLHAFWRLQRVSDCNRDGVHGGGVSPHTDLSKPRSVEPLVNLCKWGLKTLRGVEQLNLFRYEFFSISFRVVSYGCLYLVSLFWRDGCVDGLFSLICN